MSKSKPGIAGVHDANHLFRSVAATRHRTLILPKYLKDEAHRLDARRDEIQAAHAIFLKWADLESDGHLRGDETSLDEPFRQEIFGQALRYTTQTANPNAFFYDKKFYVTGVGTPDGVLGYFPPVEASKIRVVIELKDASTDLDHDKPAGRTPVQQCWDYLNNLPNCPWGIVSNFVSFRLYHRDKTQQAFEHFELQKLRDPEQFARFWAIFDREGLLANQFVKTSRVETLMAKTASRQREVGDKLYDYYSDQRIRLIEHLVAAHDQTPDQALRAAQKLLDRIIFVAFCEDRGLLPNKLIDSTWKNVAPLARVTNPRWKNFLDMFHAIDKGHPSLDLTTGYNGGLFAADENVDKLNLEDQWTTIFHEIGEYDFAEDVNVDVLGHLFEKSVSEIERLRVSAAYLKTLKGDQPLMPKSAERKRFGIYYTPPDFTRFIVEHTVGACVQERFAALATKHGVDPDQSMRTPPSKEFAAYWQECLDTLRQITIVDPACGSGAFLIAAYERLEEEYETLIEHLARHTGNPASTWADSIPESILTENLHGVDLSKEAVEITQTALWIRSARKGRRLDDLSDNIVAGNSLVTDKSVHPDAFVWKEKFPRIFQRPGGGGFDCVIGNPPWERLKLQEREFFAFSAPEIAGAVSAADRRKLIAGLKTKKPALYEEYERAKAAAERTLDHVRNAGEYPLTGRGDINTYMVFAELARKIVRATGRVGLLVPSGIATEDTTKVFFAALTGEESLIALYDFENKQGIFEDVHRSFKFCVLLFGGSAQKTAQTDFVFFAHDMRELAHKNRHVKLSSKDLALLNPNTRTCPIFKNRQDAELTKSIYKRVPVFIDKARKLGGNPWQARPTTMFHQTNDAEAFLAPDDLRKLGAKQEGNRWKKGKSQYLPLYEAKMFRPYDHRFGSVFIRKENWVNQGQTEETTLVEHQNPEFVAQPRWWVAYDTVVARLGQTAPPALLAFRDVTRATDDRTTLATFLPVAAVTNTAPFILFGPDISARRQCCLLANLNSIPLDFVAKRKVPHIHMNFFILEQLPVFPPDAYDDKCPWDKKQTLEKWISERVLKLTCTADDMRPLAEAAGFKAGVHKWKEAERADLRAELDAAYFHLYGLSREDAEYILSTFQGMTDGDEETLTPNSAASRVLDAYDALAAPA